jgi:hypothetical protein
MREVLRLKLVGQIAYVEAFSVTVQGGEMRYTFIAHEFTLRRKGIISEPMNVEVGDTRLLPNGSKLFRRGARS